MSLILEALRKSEAERRLGSAPGVLAPMPVLHAPAPRRTSRIAIAALALAVVAVALASWRMFGRAAPGDTRPAPLSAASQPIGAVAPVVAPLPAPPSVVERPVPASTVSAAAIHAPVAKPVIPAARAANPAALPFAPAMAPPRVDPLPSPPTVGRSSEQRPPLLAAPAKAPGPEAASPEPPAAAAAVEPVLLPITALPASERGALPALKVSMHVYAEDPAQRFMIVDGNRVGEGDRIGDGIVLVHILRKGAEIEVHGRRMLLPNP